MKSLLLPLLLENPILTKELRTRMRGARAFYVLGSYLGVLALILFFTYLQWWYSSNSGGGTAFAYQIGRAFFFTLFIIQALLVAGITPALTAGGISIEKEQRTMDLLTISLLPRTSVIWGKLLAALAFVALLLTASLPLISLGFLFGGVAPDEVMVAYGLLLMVAFVYGAIGVACSSVAKNTTTATVMTYGVILLLFFVTLPLVSFGVMNVMPGGSGQDLGGLKAINPLGAVLAGTANENYYGVIVPAWLTAIIVNGLFGGICVLIAIHRLDWPRSDRSGLLRLLTAVFCILLALAVYGVFVTGLLPFGGTSGGVNDTSWPALLTLGVASFLVPIFTTGDSLPSGNLLVALFDPRRLRRGEAPSGILYVLLLTLIGGGLLYISARYGLTPSSVVPRMLPASGVKLPNGVQRLAELLAGTGLFIWFSLAVVWLHGTLGVLLTAILRNRAGAFATLSALMVCFYVLPFTCVSTYDASSGLIPPTLMSLLFLTPLVGAMEIWPSSRDFIANRLSNNQMNFVGTSPILIGNSIPVTIAVPVLYLLLGCFFLVITYVIQRRRSRASV